jgi:hypothetical protein
MAMERSSQWDLGKQLIGSIIRVGFDDSYSNKAV